MSLNNFRINRLIPWSGAQAARIKLSSAPSHFPVSSGN